MLVKLLHGCMGELKARGVRNNVFPWYSFNAMPEMLSVCVCVCVKMRGNGNHCGTLCSFVVLNLKN